MCVNNLLTAHAKAYRLYKKKYFNSQRGKIGISPFSRYCFKKDSTVGDDVIDRCLQYLVWIPNIQNGVKSVISISFIDRTVLESNFW